MNPKGLRRYTWIVGVGLAMAAVLTFAQEVANQWPEAAVMEPGDLAGVLRGLGKKPKVLCVAFPVLYRSRHIVGAVFAGQGSRPDGIETLKMSVAGMPKDSDIVLYCGCCPMNHCPNIRPAYQALKEMGFTKVRVLRIPTNMAADWYDKGYPSERGAQ